MGWKGRIIEVPVGFMGRRAWTHQEQPVNPESIFVLRNNDIGDLLVVTPLFEALHHRFPSARLSVGIGDWNRDVLANNPFVSDVLPVNAPWNNKFVRPQSPINQLRYVNYSAEVHTIRDQKFTIGIDILGSHVGALLLMKARIPYRMGVHGYRGGHSAMQKNILFLNDQHAGKAALCFAQLLGAVELPECRPQLFLTASEAEAGQHRWGSHHDRDTCRIVIGPGGGLAEKCWPLSSYTELAKRLNKFPKTELIILGGKQDCEAGDRIAMVFPGAKNLAGKLTLRETFAVVKAANAVFSNSSMLMHVAAAFSIQNVVLLGESFSSAKLHEKQWGYAGTCHILGREGDLSVIPTPAEAVDSFLATWNKSC